MPATMGADTEVPVWPSVQRCRRSVVTCRERSCSPCAARDAAGAGATPLSTPGLLGMLPAGSRACRYPSPAMGPTPLGCSEPPQNGLQICLVHEKIPLLTFSFVQRCKNYLKGEKKAILLWVSWRKSHGWSGVSRAGLAWVCTHGCILSCAMLKTFLESSSSWCQARISICMGKKKKKEKKKSHFQLFCFRGEHDAWVPKAWREKLGKEMLCELHF